MILRLLIAGLLLAHGAIHMGFVSPRPPATAGGPPWPFELARSWILTPLGVQPDGMRPLGTILVAVTIGALALAALATTGLLPADLFGPAAAAGGLASLALLLLFFHPWLVLGVAVDLGLLWAVLVAGWTPRLNPIP